ncbi:MAG TPA: hypothetical protein VJP45_08220, partial [Candidatus Limnocylindria bacterium]|nr:hypothetical protein [Candidatus Limnocylindria bacterium]
KSIPSAPIGFSVLVALAQDYAGAERARVTFSWSPVTTNTDTSEIKDLARYVVRYRPVGSLSWFTTGVAATETVVSVEVPVGATQWEAQVAAVDEGGNASEWAPPAAQTFTPIPDTTPPGTPQAPTAVAGVRQVHVHWNRLDSAGQPMPADVERYEVHASGVDGFAPSAQTLVGTTRGTLLSFDAPAGTWYVKLVAVDLAGNASAASAQSAPATNSGVVQQVDIAALAIGTAQIQDLAVTSAKIASLVADKITTGSLTATVTVSGLIRTASSGPRVELNPSGVDIFAVQGSESVAQRIDWWRSGTADAGPFAKVYGYWPSTEVSGSPANSPILDFVVQDYAGSGDGLMRHMIKASDGSLYGLIEFQRDNAAGYRSWEVTFQGTGGDLKVFNNATAGNNYSEAHLPGTVRFKGAGAIFENGFTVSFSNIGAGGTANADVSYGIGWNGGLPVPEVLLGGFDAATIRDWSQLYATSRTRTGCSVRTKNIGTATGSLSAVGVPVVS